MRQKLLFRIRCCTVLFMLGLALSGLTAIPLKSELDWLSKAAESSSRLGDSNQIAIWLDRVHAALVQTAAVHPFLFYGTDWLAFGHFMIALAFVGALRDPVRNAWLFTFGILACICVVPYALLFGAVRGIPLWWRLIDCCFGIFGLVPLLICRRWTRQLAAELAKA